MKKFMILVVMAVAAITASAQKGEYFVTPHLNVGYGEMQNMTSNFELFRLEYKDNSLVGIGADFEYMLADLFGVSAGLDFNYLESISNDMIIEGRKVKTNIDYFWFNIPLLAQYHFGQFAVKAGIQPTYLIVCNMKAKATISDKHAKSSVSMIDDMNRLGLAIPLGISYTFKAPVTLDLRCALPVTSVADNGPAGKSAKLTTVSLSVGYRF